MEATTSKANKVLLSEDSESPYPLTLQYKMSSDPIQIMNSQSKKFDIPIRMSALNDSSSNTISEENYPQKTESKIEMQKLMKMYQPIKEDLTSSSQNMRYSKIKDVEGLKDSALSVFPLVTNNKYSSCKNGSPNRKLTLTQKL